MNSENRKIASAVKRIDNLETLLRLIQDGKSLNGLTIVMLDFRNATVDWSRLETKGTLFLGCIFRDDGEELVLRNQGASCLDAFNGLPYQPFRTVLYNPTELMRGTPDGDQSRLDARIYAHFVLHGGRTPDLHESLSQRIHDYSTDAALNDFLAVDENGDPTKAVVGIMGGHANKRDTPIYKKIAELSWNLARDGYLIVSGGGPGIMEAANCGAYLSAYPSSVLMEALGILEKVVEDKVPGYLESAWEIIQKYPGGTANLSIPTWYYGFETTNIFATQIAKYFSNSIREDGLISVALNGIVFAPGAAGTRQEIFMDAAQNHYGTLVGKYDWFSPMIFFGTYAYQVDTNIFQMVNQAANSNYKDLLKATDSIEEVRLFLKSHPPIKKPHQGSS